MIPKGIADGALFQSGVFFMAVLLSRYHTGVSSDSLCNMKGKLQHHGYDSGLILNRFALRYERIALKAYSDCVRSYDFLFFEIKMRENVKT